MNTVIAVDSLTREEVAGGGGGLEPGVCMYVRDWVHARTYVPRPLAT